jgi:hypothetical protein
MMNLLLDPITVKPYFCEHGVGIGVTEGGVIELRAMAHNTL